MKTVYRRCLKKFTVKDISEMRKFALRCVSPETLAEKFNCNKTTVIWHCGDIYENNYQYKTNVQ